MNAVIDFLLIAVAALLTIPTVVFCSEVFAAIALPQRKLPTYTNRTARPRLAVLVPAHNESTGLLPTLADIRNQLNSGDQLLVVADNCSDDTAAVARTGGAAVIERHDPAKLGKGFALDYGLQHFALDPPEVIISIDADCRVKDGTIDQLAFSAKASGRPVQGGNIMTSPAVSPINHQIAEFAWRVKQCLRPLGLRALHLPCQIAGTGMAFPWDAIRSVDLKSGSLAEDLKLGLELTLAGYPPTFCPCACVISEFPSSLDGTKTQRKRWEQGHIQAIAKQAPRLVSLAITYRNWDLLVLTLDLMVPPLSLLVMMVAGSFVISGLAAIAGLSSVPFAISASTLLGFVATILAAWLNCGRDILPASAIFSIAPYVLRKISLYRQIISGQADTKWRRTDRTNLTR